MSFLIPAAIVITVGAAIITPWVFLLVILFLLSKLSQTSGFLLIVAGVLSGLLLLVSSCCRCLGNEHAPALGTRCSTCT